MNETASASLATAPAVAVFEDVNNSKDWYEQGLSAERTPS